MKLEKYLQAIIDCPDKSFGRNEESRLSTQWGVADNYPILFGSDFGEIASVLENLDNFKLTKRDISIFKRAHAFYNYKPGTIILQLINDASINYFPEDFPSRKEIIIRYKTTITLHDYQYDRKIPNISNERAIALVICEIANYARKKGITLCFPNSRGWDHRKDFSRTVFYNPQEEGTK